MIAACRGEASFRGWSPDFLQEKDVTIITGRRTLWELVWGQNTPGLGLRREGSTVLPHDFWGPSDFSKNENTTNFLLRLEVGEGAEFCKKMEEAVLRQSQCVKQGKSTKRGYACICPSVTHSDWTQN